MHTDEAITQKVSAYSVSLIETRKICQHLRTSAAKLTQHIRVLFLLGMTVVQSGISCELQTRQL